MEERERGKACVNMREGTRVDTVCKYVYVCARVNIHTCMYMYIDR